MKKIISLVLFVSLFLMATSVALAEPFTLHCGITFEMTKDEIIQAIKDGGYEPEEKQYADGYAGLVPHSSSKTYIEYSARIGNRKATITIHFIENTTPTVIHYTFNPYAEENEIDELGYQSMEAALQDKYGAPEYKENTGRMFPYGNSALSTGGYHAGMMSVDSATCTIGESRRNGSLYISSCPNYSQWVVSDGDTGYVGISHTFSNITQTDMMKEYVKSSYYFEHVSYSHMSKGSYDYLMNKQQKSYDGI